MDTSAASMASSLPGAHRRLIASNAATRDHGTSASSRSTACSKKRSSSQPLPQFQSQKAGAELPCSFQPHLVQQHARDLRIVGRRLHMRREQLQLLRFALFIEDLDGFQPARLRRTVQLAQITERLLPRTIGVRTVSTSDQ